MNNAKINKTSIDHNKLKRQQKQTCRGIAENKSGCRYAVEDGKQCCKRSHADMEDYTDEMFENLQLCKHCPRPRWRYFGDNDRCDNCQKEENNNHEEEFCMGTQKSDGKPCRNKIVNGNRFCLRNHAYMENYTDDMMDNLKKCSGCLRLVYNGHFLNDSIQCMECQKRGEGNRAVIKKLPKKMCQHEGCKYSVKDEGVFCGLHKKIDQFLIDAAEQGKNPCDEYIRGCRTLLDPDYKNKRCEECLKKIAGQDRIRRNTKKKKATKAREENKDAPKCSNNGCSGVDKNMSHFKTENGKESLICDECREKNKEKDRGRKRINIKTNDKVLNAIKKSADKRKIAYDIPEEFALKTLQENCHYCGIHNAKENDYGIKYSYMTFDRIDSNKYYTADNIVSACIMCNVMKLTHTQEDFMKYCKNIFDNFGSENDWDHNNVERLTYARHVADCRKKKRKNELNSRDVLQITQKRCYYCDNTNRPNQIGIDRVDPNIGYTKKNTLVACCSICNLMKLDTKIDEFYNHILKILLTNAKITQEQYDGNVKKIKKITNRKKWVIEELSKTFEYDGKQNQNRKGIHIFDKPSKYYIDKIWGGYNIQYFEPEIIFCETEEEINIWMFFRLIISSHFPTKCNGKDHKILIRDKFTQMYVAITSLSCSRPNWSDATDIGKILRVRNVYNISTCVAIPPFSYNFNGGKLATLLMFSKEVYEYMASKNIIIAGLMTYSLHGDSIQYSGIDSFKFVGYTKCKGIDNTKVPMKVYTAMKNIMIKEHFPIEDRITNVKLFCATNGIIDATVHNVKRGIYFGTTGNNSIDFLQEKTGQFEPTLKSVREISEYWYLNFAIPRINELIKRNNMMVNYNYDAYYVDDTGYNRHRKKKSLMKKRTYEDDLNDDNEKRKVINYWMSHYNDSLSSMEKALNLDRRSITNIIFQNNYKQMNDDLKIELKSHIAERSKLFEKNEKHKFKVAKVDEIIRKEHNYNENSKKIDNNIQLVFVKRNLYITYQKCTDLSNLSRFTKIEGVMSGKWNIVNNECDGKNDNIITLVHEKCNIDGIEKTKTLHEANNMIFKIGISQKDIEFNISDMTILETPLCVTGKNNVFVDTYRKTITNKIEITLGYGYNEITKLKLITYIHIKLVQNHHRINTECSCDDCIHFMAKKFTQKTIYTNNYLGLSDSNEQKSCLEINDMLNKKNTNTSNNKVIVMKKVKKYKDEERDVQCIVKN